MLVAVAPRATAFRAWAESLLFEWSKRSNQEKTTPRPRRPRIRRVRFPAVLGVGGPLRNSHIPVLGHARFPPPPPPLLGAPEGPLVPSTRLPAWVLRGLVPQDLRVGYRSEAEARSEARSEATSRSKAATRCSCSADKASHSILAEHIELRARLEDQAGSRVEGTMGSPVEHRREPGCKMHPGRGSGVHLSLLLSGQTERSDPAVRPKCSCF